MTQNFLLEIGAEELPASYVAKALEAMPELASKMLATLRVKHGTMRAFGTPRRLALIIEDLATSQEDLSELVQGPSKSVAFAADGTLTKAGESFVAKLGKTAADVQTVTTPKGEYIAVQREEKGRPASELLPSLIPQLCAAIPFQKSMRWGAGDVAFGRPIQWIIALHGNGVIDTSFAGIASGRTTLGHRFLHPGAIEIGDASKYIDALRAAHVLVDPAERRATMHERLLAAAKEAGGELIDDAFLMDECLSLVEEPHVVIGGFEEAFLALPDEVIVAVMRGHQRYFAIRNPKSAEGRLLPAYLTVVNTANDPTTIRRGNDRVLRARLADARFFVEEDRKRTLGTYAEKLTSVVFQAKLGTIAEKVARVGEVAARLANANETAIDPQKARQAASLAKADLVSYIVGEFPELQGLMGRYYALEQGVAPDVANAIRDHYLPKGASDVVPNDPLSAVLAVADRADTLVGCFGIGLQPSGSADPFALRRATLGIVRIGLEGPIDVDLNATFALAFDGLTGKPVGDRAAVLAKLDEFARTRLRVFFAERISPDAADACLAAWDGGSVRDLEARVRALQAFRALPEFDALATAFKRAANIAKDAPAGEVDAATLTDDAEKVLAEKFFALRETLVQKTSQRDYEGALMTIARELRGPIDAFFENVFVMVEDERIRANRLRLLRSIAETLSGIADFQLLGQNT
jgi:glycyl-tRNA synthetase beta chain